jgi:hypothetical protein
MAGTLKRLAGPVALSSTLTTNIYNNTSALVTSVVKQIHIANKTSSAATYTIYLGATGANAAGTELFFARTLAANDAVDIPFYPGLLLASTDFLVGGSGTATALTITILGELNAV